MKRMIFLVTVVFWAGLLVVHAETESPVTFDMLKQGKELFENNCIDCHELEWPLKKVTDRAGWEEILTKMANTGAILDQKDRSLVLEYLVAKSTFQKQCVLCHGAERSLEQNKDFQSWMATVRRMVGKRPGLLTEEQIRSVAGFLTVGR
jgi:mono/diheme cytochrome c family protein